MIVGIVLIVAAVTVFLSIRGEGTAAYKEKIVRKRQEIDRFMKYAPDSPFRRSGNYQGLRYYPPDPKYRVTAKFILIEEKVITPLAMNDGSTESYIRYAWAEFELDGARHRLLVLKGENEQVTNRLFLAFTDATSGKETYGGGRYLNVFQIKEDEVTFDFNLAYNPYCVYDYSYVCPIPPPENQLQPAIEAGEKLYVLDTS